MNNPELYNANNELQRKTTLNFLNEYSEKIKWNKNGDTAIDIGCGDGSVTVIVKNFAPCTFKVFVGSDISENMVNFANKRYADENIAFEVLDIKGDLPENMIGKFNHVFSFFALHWVKDQESAFMNIRDLMAEGGDCFLTFVGNSAIYSVYNVLAQLPQWKSLLKDFDVFISPYHNIKNPREKVAEIMEKCGYKNIDVTCKSLKSHFDSLEVLKSMSQPLIKREESAKKYMIQSLDPFNMPQDVFDELMKDYVAVGKDIGALKFNTDPNDPSPFITLDYSLVVIYAQK